MKRIVFLILAAVGLLTAAAQEQTLVDRLRQTGKARIVQSPKLNDRLRPAAKTETVETPAITAEAPKTAGGFRVLIFSSNNPRNAKSEAERRSAILFEQFPEYPAYTSYDAPYWRLKVGNFRSYDEASAALSRLRTALPAYAKEMRIVRERINL